MTDEIVQVISDKPNDYVRIEFMVSNVCNYSCWYCNPADHIGDHRWTNNLDLLLKNFEHLLDFYKINGKKKIELNLLGGEPTLWPNLIKFVTKLKQGRDLKVTMTSNGSRTRQWWDKNSAVFNKILFSYHPSFTNNKHFIDIVDLVYSKGIPCNALIMMDPKYWNESMAMVEECNASSKYSWFITLCEVHSALPYTKKQKEIISQHCVRKPNLFRLLKDEFYTIIKTKKPKVVFKSGEEKKITPNWISLNKLNNFQGWMCNIGIENINIKMDGSITGTCLEVPFGEDNFYNIYDTNFTKNFAPRLKPTMCTKKGCYCQPEILMNKFKP